MTKVDFAIRAHSKDLSSKNEIVQSLNNEGIIVAVSPKWLTTMGYEKDDVVGEFFGKFLTEDSIKQVQQNFPHLKDYGFVDNVPLKLVKKDGIIIEAALDGSSLYDEKGDFIRTFCELRTLDYYMNSAIQTARLLEKERFLHTISIVKGDITSLYAQKLTSDEYIQNVKDILQEPSEVIACVTEPQEELKKQFNMSCTADSKKEISCVDQSFQAFKTDDQKKKDKGVSHIIIFWINDHRSNIGKSFFKLELSISDDLWSFWQDSLQILALAIEIGLKDIYAEVELEEKTKEIAMKNEQLEEAQKIAKIGYWSLNLINNQLLWSNEIFKIFEIDKNKFEPSYESFLNVIHPDDRNIVDNTYTNSLKNKTDYSIKHRLLMSDGRIKWIQEECKTDFDSQGNPLISIGTLQDITEAYEKEQLLFEKTKLMALNELILNISHQWRQPLSVISMRASLIRFDNELDTLTDDKINEACIVIDNNSQYLSKTIDNFANIIKGDMENIEFNLNDNIDNFLSIVSESIKNDNINVILSLHENININGRANELIQCFINIFTNAKDALHNLENDKYIFITTTLYDEDNVLISFRDNGGGIPEDILAKIFEPYFTTEHQSQGKGLGLHMTYNLIDSMGGIIDVHNINYEYKGNSYIGAKFTIRLPLN